MVSVGMCLLHFQVRVDALGYHLLGLSPPAGRPVPHPPALPTLEAFVVFYGGKAAETGLPTPLTHCVPCERDGAAALPAEAGAMDC